MVEIGRSLELRWERADSGEFRDTGSDNLVEYRIQDLPLDRTEECVEYMLHNYVPDEPFAQALKFAFSKNIENCMSMRSPNG